MNKFLVGAFSFLFMGQALAAESNAIAIYEVQNAQGSFIQVPLTHELYSYSQHPNLHNLAVLDAEQNSLPYRLVSTNQRGHAEPKIISSSLAFFPVAADATPDSLRKLQVTHVSVQGNKVQIATSDKLLDSKAPEFYLIDISKIEFDISKLRIDWDVQTDNQYLEVELAATSNLQDWISLGRATLVNLSAQGQSLKRNSIDANIAKGEYEFLRIRVVRGAENLKISQVIAEQKQILPELPQKLRESWRLQGELAKTQTSLYLPSSHSKTYPVAAWEFARNEVTPIEQMSIDLGANYYGDRVILLSRNNLNENWQLQHQGVWFNVQLGSQWQASDSIALRFNSAKYWRLELSSLASSIKNPALVFFWYPLELQFIANHKPPFTLAIQPNQIDRNNREQIFEQILATSSPNWERASLHKLDVSPDAVTNIPTSRDWKQWIFWCALMLAVVVLLLFSFKLFKQLNLQQPKP